MPTPWNGDWPAHAGNVTVSVFGISGCVKTGRNCLVVNRIAADAKLSGAGLYGVKKFMIGRMSRGRRICYAYKGRRVIPNEVILCPREERGGSGRLQRKEKKRWMGGEGFSL